MLLVKIMGKTFKEIEKEYFYNYIVEVLSIAKIGLLFSSDPYAISNYKEIEKISMDALNKFTKLKIDRNNFFSRDVYPTPNISTRAVIYNDKNEILLVKEVLDDKYCLPGGWIDLFDSPLDGIKKECLQEAGCTIKDIELIGAYKKNNNERIESNDFINAVPEIQLVFKCKVDNFIKEHDYEVKEVKYFSLDNLPLMSKKISKEDFNYIINCYKNGKIIVN